MTNSKSLRFREMVDYPNNQQLSLVKGRRKVPDGVFATDTYLNKVVWQWVVSADLQTEPEQVLASMRSRQEIEEATLRLDKGLCAC